MLALVWNKLDEKTGDPSPQQGSFGLVDPKLARSLATRYRPWLKFDTSERWRPLNVRAFLDEGRNKDVAHEVCPHPETRSGCEPARGFQDFIQRADGAGFSGEPHLDVHADGAAVKYHSPDLAACEHRQVVQECEHGDASAIYYRVTRGGDRFYVDYWWFFRYNDGGPKQWDHEGDWEGVTVVTRPENQNRLDYVAFATHSARFRIVGPQLEMHGSRPVVYVALGTHASYPRSCTDVVCGQLLQVHGLFPRPERSIDGKSPWARNEPAICRRSQACLRPMPAGGADPTYSWTIWSGHWGKDKGSPMSPGRQSRYGSPWCSRGAGGDECDGLSAGCDAWVGATVRVAVCVPQAALSSTSTGHGVPPAIKVGTDAPLQAIGGAGILQSLGRPPRLADGIRFTGLGARGTQVVVRANVGHSRSSYTEARFDGVERLGDGHVRLQRCLDTTRATLCLAALGRPELPAAAQHTYTPPAQ